MGQHEINQGKYKVQKRKKTSKLRKLSRLVFGGIVLTHATLIAMSYLLPGKYSLAERTCKPTELGLVLAEKITKEEDFFCNQWADMIYGAADLSQTVVDERSEPSKEKDLESLVTLQQYIHKDEKMPKEKAKDSLFKPPQLIDLANGSRCTAVLMTEDGWFATAEHCFPLDGSFNMVLEHQGKGYRVLAYRDDKSHDVAIGKADLLGKAKPVQIHYLNANTLREGQPVHSIGYGLGILDLQSGVVNLKINNAQTRNMLGQRQTHYDHLTTTVSATFGFSGGPTIDDDSYSLVGINSSIESNIFELSPHGYLHIAKVEYVIKLVDQEVAAARKMQKEHREQL